MKPPSRIELVTTGRDPRIDRTLDVVAEALTSAGAEVREVTVPARGLPRDLTTEEERTWGSFKATPQACMESWRVARHLDRLVRPRGTVLVPDRGGIGGMFALEQAMRPTEQRVTVLVTAADGLLLEYQAVAGTHDGVDEESASAIDWELVGYRCAAAVLATSPRAAEVLGGVGVAAHVVTRPVDARPKDSSGVKGIVYLPESVSRLSQTPGILRAINAAREVHPELRVLVNREDREDVIWSGSTWEASDGIRAVLGEVIQRRRVRRPDLMILGDPYAVPDPKAQRWYEHGVRTMVPEGSTAASRWPEALGWRDEWHLTELLIGKAEGAPSPTAGTPGLSQVTWSPDRAQRVSVGIPIFRDVRYLDDCLASVLAQDQAPHEVILVDDGSRSAEVDASLERWQADHPELIRILRQPNRGVCVARNRALEEMTGDAFVLIDQDDELAPSFISACSAALRGNTELWAVATWTEFFGDYQGIEAKPPFDRRVGLRENPIISTCALVDLRVRDLGIRFSPDLAWISSEDWDFWAQIVAAGGGFGLVARPLARHRVHTASGGFRRTEVAWALGRARVASRLR